MKQFEEFDISIHLRIKKKQHNSIITMRAQKMKTKKYGQYFVKLFSNGKHARSDLPEA